MPPSSLSLEISGVGKGNHLSGTILLGSLAFRPNNPTDANRAFSKAQKKGREMLREKIQDKYKELTPSFRKLADFILQHQLDAVFMTATEMADQMEVDAATVVRFAQNLGYTGFRELSEELQRTVREELTTSYQADLNAPNDLGLFRGLLENERHNLKLTQDQLTEQVSAILPTFLDVEHIWVLGQGKGTYLAGLCAESLREIGLLAISIASDPLSAAMNLKEVSTNDMVIGFSVTGMEPGVAKALRFARQRGAKTLTFSNLPMTETALASEMTITCPGPTQTEADSFTSLAAMIVVLVTAFTARYPEEAETMAEEIEQSYQELLEDQ